MSGEPDTECPACDGRGTNDMGLEFVSIGCILPGPKFRPCARCYGWGVLPGQPVWEPHMGVFWSWRTAEGTS